MSSQGKTLPEIVAEWAAPLPPPTPERLAEIDRERGLAEQARRDARRPVELKPGTKVKVHIRGWMYDSAPAEVVHDSMGDGMTSERQITAKRLRGDVEERVTVNFRSVSLWRA